METDLETGLVVYDYTIDFLPLVALRHLPTILKENDKVVKVYELGVLTLYKAAVIGIWGPLIYNAIKHSSEIL